MRLQITACLLCLMTVGASLDMLPDPPALNPQRNQRSLVSRLYYQVPVAAKSHVLDCPAGDPHFQASPFSSRQIFESAGPSHRLIFVRQAADSSPPSCS
jgi:hypothetical protein